MSFNGSGVFQINSFGQPVVAGTLIEASVFNLFTEDVAGGLSNTITRDGQSATTVRIPFAFGINSSLVDDSINVNSGSIISQGGLGVAKSIWAAAGKFHVDGVTGDTTIGGTLSATGAISGTTGAYTGLLSAKQNIAGDTTVLTIGQTSNVTANSQLDIVVGGTSVVGRISSNYNQPAGTASLDVYAYAAATLSKIGSFSSTGLAVTGTLSATGAITVGTNAASVGALRIANTASLVSRNAANSGDILLIYADASNVVQIGGGSNVNVAGTLSATGNVTVNGTTPLLTMAATGAFSYLNFTNSGGATKASLYLTNSSGITQIRSEQTHVTNYDASSTYGTFSATGLAVTGRISATQDILIPTAAPLYWGDGSGSISYTNGGNMVFATNSLTRLSISNAGLVSATVGFRLTGGNSWDWQDAGAGSMSFYNASTALTAMVLDTAGQLKLPVLAGAGNRPVYANPAGILVV